MVTFQECCFRSVLKPDAAFCVTCGGPLPRCMNFSDCLQIVPPGQPCPICLNPEVATVDGAAVSGGVGAKLAIPLRLRNHNETVRRPIYLKALQKREADGGFADVPLGWELVDGGSERQFLVEAGPFEHDGNERVELRLTLATRSREGYEESYLYGGALLLDVSAKSGQQVIQNIDLAGAQFGTGGLVNIGGSQVKQPETAEQAGAAGQVVALERLELDEILTGLRGYRERRQRVLRTVEFHCHGFNETDAPSYPIGLGARGALALGRSGTMMEAAENPAPMDVSLRVYGVDGALDVEASTRISRHHFDLTVLNDRLTVHVRSAGGARLNDTALPSGSITAVEDGDLIRPTPDAPLGLRARFAPGPHGSIDRIDLHKERPGR